VLLIALGLYLPHAPGADAEGGIGERPAAGLVCAAQTSTACAYSTHPGRVRLIGLAGAILRSRSKDWLERAPSQGLDGIGWIALSITIFGGWNPLRAAFGAYPLRSCSAWVWCCSRCSRVYHRRCCRWRPSR